MLMYPPHLMILFPHCCFCHVFLDKSGIWRLDPGCFPELSRKRTTMSTLRATWVEQSRNLIGAVVRPLEWQQWAIKVPEIFLGVKVKKVHCVFILLNFFNFQKYWREKFFHKKKSKQKSKLEGRAAGVWSAASCLICVVFLVNNYASFCGSDESRVLRYIFSCMEKKKQMHLFIIKC